MSATYILKEVGDSLSPCVQRRRLAEISGCSLPRLPITVTWRALKTHQSSSPTSRALSLIAQVWDQGIAIVQDVNSSQCRQPLD